MSAKIIDGRSIAKQKQADIRSVIVDKNLRPKLAIILVNDTPASEIYVSRKMKACQDVGIEPILHQHPVDTTQANLMTLIETLNKDDSIHEFSCNCPWMTTSTQTI